MDVTAEHAMHHYAEAYQRLYNRKPRDLRAIDSHWVIVNGARMRANELEYLTRQLQLEYDQSQAAKRNVVKRLLKWFTQ